MGKIFESVSSDFFSILSGMSKNMYDDILTLLYDKSLKEDSFTFNKEVFVNYIEEYFNNNIYVGEDASEYRTSRDKATAVYRKLKARGWIDEEIGVNQNILVNFQDYTIAFLNLWFDYTQDNTFEFSGDVYELYNTIKNFDPVNAFVTLQKLVSNSQRLIKKLRSLNSNIKKYINKVIKIENKNEVELLKELLTQLLGDYKEKIIDKAYYFMKTYNNPKKYRLDFENKINDIMNDDNEINIIINDIASKNEINIEEARDKCYEMLNYLSGVFNTIIQIMSEIDVKNSKYINVTIEKINIILNNDTDVVGALLNILKNFNLLKDDIKFKINNVSNINDSSLYVPHINKEVIRSKLINNKIEINENQLLEDFKRSMKFSKNAIKEMVIQMLKNKNSLTINDFNIKSSDDLVCLILTIIYAYQNENEYKIEWKDKKVKYNGIEMIDFIIKEVK